MPAHAFALLLCAASSALAVDLVAVLPIDSTHARLEPGDVAVFQQTLQSVSAERLERQGYTVLAAETTLRVLADNGVEAAQACDASCGLETAREVKATLFVSGSLATSEGRHVANLRVFDSTTAKMVSSVEVEANTIQALRQALRDQGPSLFDAVSAPGGSVPGAPASTSDRAWSWRVRAGLATSTGFLGAGADLYVSDLVSWTFGLGLGGPSLGLTVGARRSQGGPFVTAAVASPLWFGADAPQDSSATLTGGYEWTFGGAWAVRAGLGVSLAGFPVKARGGILPFPDLTLARSF